MSGKTPSFDMIPSQSQLDAMERRLEFFPADATNPQTLSRKQVAGYNETGFLAPLDIFSRDETEQHRAYFDDLLAQYLADGKDSYSISTAHLRHQGVYNLLVEPRIVGLVRDLLGDNVVGWGSHYFCKMPGDGKQVSWHQDAGYWPLSPSKTVTVWLAIDDSDRGNGCMRVIPGTHQLGEIPFERSGTEEDNVLNQTVTPQAEWAAPIDVELTAGQISIHSDLLVHGSDANQSDRRRCGLTLRYCSADVSALLSWNLKGVVISGEADASLWPGAQRPQSR